MVQEIIEPDKTHVLTNTPRGGQFVQGPRYVEIWCFVAIVGWDELTPVRREHPLFLMISLLWRYIGQSMDHSRD